MSTDRDTDFNERSVFLNIKKSRSIICCRKFFMNRNHSVKDKKELHAEKNLS